MFIPENHPLRTLFRELTYRHLYESPPVRDRQIAEYISGVLTDFAHVDNLHRIRNARGKRLEDVGEMLIESNPLLEGRSFEREREVRKHIGDYTLFFTGIFPESLSPLYGRRRLRLDSLIDYVRAGKESYAVVAAFDQFEYRSEAPLFRRLSENFEQCVYGLNLVKQDLQRLQAGYYRKLHAALGGPPA